MTLLYVSATRYSKHELLCCIVAVLLVSAVPCPLASAGRTISIAIKIKSPYQRIIFSMSWEHSDVYKDGEFAIYASVNIGCISPSSFYIRGTNRATLNYTYDPCGPVRYQDVRITIKEYFYTSPKRSMFFENIDYVVFLPYYRVTVTSPIGVAEGTGEYPAGALLTPKVNETEIIFDDVRYKLSKWLVKVAGEEPYYVEDGQKVKVEQVTDIEALYSKYYLVKVLSQYGSAIGGGWYEEGDVANFDVEPKEIRVNETSKAVFSHWELNGVPVNHTYVTVDGPKTAVAMWLIRRVNPEAFGHSDAVGENPVQTALGYADKKDGFEKLVDDDKHEAEESSGDGEEPMESVKIMAVSPFGNVRGVGTYDKGAFVSVNVTPTYYLAAENVRLSFSGWVDLTSGELVTKDPVLSFTAEDEKFLQAVWTLQYFVGGSWHGWDEVIELAPPEVEYVSNGTRRVFSGFWRKGSSAPIRSNRINISAWESVFVRPLMEVQHELTICVEGLGSAVPIVVEVGNSSFVLKVVGKAQLWVREGGEVMLIPPEVVGNMTLRSISGENASKFGLQINAPETVEILYAPTPPKFEAGVPEGKINEIFTAALIVAPVLTASMALRRRRGLSLEELKRALRGERPLPSRASVDYSVLESLKREDKELYMKALIMASSGKLEIKPRR